MVKWFYLTHKWDSKVTISSGLGGSGSNDNKGLLHIPQSSRTEASPSDSLVSYPGLTPQQK